MLVMEKSAPGLIVYDDVIDITELVTEEYDKMKQD